MRSAMYFGIMFAFALVVGSVANMVGVTQDTPNAPGLPTDPGAGNIFDQILAPLKWAWDAVAAFFQLATFQVDSFPPIFSIMLVTPVVIVSVWLLIGRIRGSE